MRRELVAQLLHGGRVTSIDTDVYISANLYCSCSALDNIFVDCHTGYSGGLLP